MISSLHWELLSEDGKSLSKDCISIQESSGSNQLGFKLEFTRDCIISELFVEFYICEPIQSWRYLDYTWREVSENVLISNSLSPKLLKLKSGQFFVAKNNVGCWEYLPNSGRIRWYFYHPMLSPTLVYDSSDKRVFLKSQKIKAGTAISSGWIWTKGSVQEWARTPIGFVPTVCFTDHSDFDTLENLKVQREFFHTLGIKVTKGFFLYDYTHKAENASYENILSRNELVRWEQDGHELAYHALSQSYRGKKSEEEFLEFSSPPEISKVETYIDHGFHPYNYTKQPLGMWDSWYDHMEQKGIKRIWTYVDAGEGNYLNGNQLNPHLFSWSMMRESSKLTTKRRVKRKKLTDFRNFLMYGVSESVLQAGKLARSSLMTLFRKPSIRGLFNLLKSLVVFLIKLFSPRSIAVLFKKSGKVFEVNRFGIVFFTSPNQQNTSIRSFQSLAVRDFDIVYSKEALELLQKEAGLMIAHTYFSYVGQNHEGRLFEDTTWRIRPSASSGFDRLSKMIKAGQLWNPTLKELHHFVHGLEQIEYVLQGEDLKIKNFNGVFREIN